MNTVMAMGGKITPKINISDKYDIIRIGKIRFSNKNWFIMRALGTGCGVCNAAGKIFKTRCLVSDPAGKRSTHSFKYALDRGKTNETMIMK